ncbi:MAG TPA: DNA polymerase I [Deltaproteobacteria bacterium]|nr:DNA polymerase I [Deltaproteobacteria bacterium]HPR51600.1 DNA polymerase I [Deltaproteobacteria bacterium]
MTEQGNLYLIDGSSYVYRAFYAMRNLSTSKGMPTNAIYIFSRMLLKLLKDKDPQHICFVLDSRGPTHRHAMYKDYKATRQKMPEDLQIQIPYIIDIVQAMGIPLVQIEGLEADDIIASLARRYESDFRVVIISGDKDLMQLVNEKTSVWDTLKDTTYDRDAVKEKYGVYPEYIADLLAIMGDSSDNIPGIPGIGAKGATSLINSFGHLQEIIDNTGQIKSAKQKSAIEENQEHALLGYELVRLDKDVEVGITPETFCKQDMDTQKLTGLFGDLEFKGLLAEISQGEPVDVRQGHDGTIEYTLKKDLSGEAGMYVIPGTGSSVFQENISYVCLDPRTYLDPLKNPGLNLCMHDAKRSLVAAKRDGIEIRAGINDTMLAAYCIDAASGTSSLEDLSRAHLDRVLHTEKELSGTGRNARGMDQIEESVLAGHLASHAQVLVPLQEILSREMKQLGVDGIYFDIEIPLTGVLADLEDVGVLIDVDVLSDISREITFHLDAMEKQIFAMAGKTFNINSPKQLGVILFEDLSLPVVKKTKTGYSTDSKVLEALATRHELPALILDYRTFSKLKSTYVDALPSMIDPVTGRIHTLFNQAITATGRISSSEPNLQNIPIRTEMGRRIRQAFVAPEGFAILSADYSQIELRILAHISKDETLKNSFVQGVDIHARTAAEVFDTPLEMVTEDQRRQAKTINFGIIYGMGPHKLSQELGIKRDVAKRYIENYLAKYPGVNGYMESIYNKASKDGFVTTIMGRRRTIPQINSDNFNEREGARRIAINTPIQGSAADIIKIAMVKIHEKIRTMKSRMILQVHDELVFEAALDEIEELRELVRYEMENAIALSVPTRVDIGVGKNWAEAH